MPTPSNLAYTSNLVTQDEHSNEGQILLLFAKLMQGGQEDADTCKDLDQLTQLFNQDLKAAEADKSHKSITSVIDFECVDTLLGHLDVRHGERVRAHATLTTSTYLKAAGKVGHKHLSTFFSNKLKRGTYDDHITCYCVATMLFPLMPDVMAELLLSEGLLSSLGTLMSKKWKSRKVGTACLEMLNAACISSACRDAIQKHCGEWLEEVSDEDPAQDNGDATSPDGQAPSVTQMRRHCQHVRNLAAVILVKIKSANPQQSANLGHSAKVQTTASDMSNLCSIFTTMVLEGEESEQQNCIEGLAYASINPNVKESVAKDAALLEQIVKRLSDAPSKSPIAYGALTIFANLTAYPPVLSEEQAKMAQLQAYSNAQGKLSSQNSPESREVVDGRCKAVFEAGVVPALVAQAKVASIASLSLIVSIIASLSVSQTLCGKLAQQGAVKLLLASWSAFPEQLTISPPPRTTAAQALARILIKTNPSLVFGGNRATMLNAIQPLASLLVLRDSDGPRDLLPTFEALMALTNLASVDDETRSATSRSVWPALDDLLFSSNKEVCRASTELVCNLALDPSTIEYYVPFGSSTSGDKVSGSAAANRLNVVLALTDAEDSGTRSAAGGALASLTADARVVQGILHRDRGVEAVLRLCSEDDEDLMHRGVYVVCNMVDAAGGVGAIAREMLIKAGALDTLKKVAMRTRRPQVMEVTAGTLKTLLDGYTASRPF